MQRAIRYSGEAHRFAALADHSDLPLRPAYLSIASAYRVLAQSVVVELWWPSAGASAVSPDLGGEPQG
jgi:hypothetical protein